MDVSRYKVLVATPNYTNLFTSEVHTNHIECATHWKKLGIDFNWLIVGRTFVHFARTQACDAAIKGNYTHIFWVDDDAVIDPDILPKFLEHDKDIVISPYPMRKAPHEIGVLVSTVGDFHKHESYRNLTMDDMDQGLIEVDGGGTHAMLVKVDVLKMRPTEDAPDPYPEGLKKLLDSLTEEQRKEIDHFVGNLPDETFTLQEENDDLGKPYFMMPKSGTEDMYFCYRAKKKGAKIWCDTDVFSGHVGFYPVIRKYHTEHYHNQLTSAPQEANGLNSIKVASDKAQEVSGVRANELNTNRATSLA